MRIGLGERRRNPTQTSGEHHRSSDITARTENDVGSATGKDTGARNRRTHGMSEGANEAEADSPRETGYRKRVELEACVRNQLRLDAAARPGERHRHSALAQRFGDRERRPDVPCRSPGRDQARELGRPFHSRRC